VNACCVGALRLLTPSVSGTEIYAWVRCAERATLTPIAGSAIFDRARTCPGLSFRCVAPLSGPYSACGFPEPPLRRLAGAALFCCCQFSLLRQLLFRVPDDDQLLLAPLNGGIAHFVSGRPRAESSERSLICSPSATLPGLPIATRAATFCNGAAFRDSENVDVLVQVLLPSYIDRHDSSLRSCCGMAPTAGKSNRCRCQRFSGHLGRTLVARVVEILRDRNCKPRLAPANRACAIQKGLEMPPVPRPTMSLLSRKRVLLRVR
jgi:hypothetical protein